MARSPLLLSAPTSPPPLLVGATVSVVGHAGLLGAFSIIPSGVGVSSVPVLERSPGDAIRVHVVSRADTGDLAAEPETEPFASVPPDDAFVLPAPPPAAALAPDAPDAPARVRTDARGADREDPGSGQVDAAEVSAFVEALRSLATATTKPPPRDVLPAESEVPAPRPSPGAPPPLDVEPVRMAEASAGAPRVRPAPPASRRGVDRAATIMRVPPPVYPRRCIRLRQEGTAVVEATVRADGSVASVVLRTSSGFDRLDDAALEAARRGRFQPALRSGRPIEARIVIPFEFRLKPGR